MNLAVVRDLRPQLRLGCPMRSRRSSRTCWPSSCWPARRRGSPTPRSARTWPRCWSCGSGSGGRCGRCPPRTSMASSAATGARRRARRCVRRRRSRSSSSSWSCGTGPRSMPPQGSWWSPRWMRSTGPAAAPAPAADPAGPTRDRQAVRRMAEGLAHRAEIRPGRAELHGLRLVSLIGPRVSELCLLSMRDLCWELGRFGKMLLRGKGSRGRGRRSGWCR